MRHDLASRAHPRRALDHAPARRSQSRHHPPVPAGPGVHDPGHLARRVGGGAHPCPDRRAGDQHPGGRHGRLRGSTPGRSLHVPRALRPHRPPAAAVDEPGSVRGAHRPDRGLPDPGVRDRGRGPVQSLHRCAPRPVGMRRRRTAVRHERARGGGGALVQRRVPDRSHRSGPRGPDRRAGQAPVHGEDDRRPVDGRLPASVLGPAGRLVRRREHPAAAAGDRSPRARSRRCSRRASSTAPVATTATG